MYESVLIEQHPSFVVDGGSAFQTACVSSDWSILSDSVFMIRAHRLGSIWHGEFMYCCQVAISGLVVHVLCGHTIHGYNATGK